MSNLSQMEVSICLLNDDFIWTIGQSRFGQTGKTSGIFQLQKMDTKYQNIIGTMHLRASKVKSARK